MQWQSVFTRLYTILNTFLFLYYLLGLTVLTKVAGFQSNFGLASVGGTLGSGGVVFYFIYIVLGKPATKTNARSVLLIMVISGLVIQTTALFTRQISWAWYGASLSCTGFGTLLYLYKVDVNS